MRCAWFHTDDSATFRAVVAFATGAAAIFGGIGVKGSSAFMDLLQPDPDVPKHLPHNVAVVICDGGVEIWAGDSRRHLGPLLVTYREGKFNGRLHRYPGRVDVTIDEFNNGRMALTSKWTITNRTSLNVARSVVLMSKAADH